MAAVCLVLRVAALSLSLSLILSFNSVIFLANLSLIFSKTDSATLILTDKKAEVGNQVIFSRSNNRKTWDLSPFSLVSKASIFFIPYHPHPQTITVTCPPDLGLPSAFTSTPTELSVGTVGGTGSKDEGDPPNPG